MTQKKKPAPKKAPTNKEKAKIYEKTPLDHVLARNDLDTKLDITPSGRGRPKQAGDMKKITLTISHDQIIWLDRLATDIREASRVIIDRGTIIRALISALENSGLDIKHCASEREIQEIITRKLGSKE